jgi:acyl-coenzyme A thioesterase PaaI-like protein
MPVVMTIPELERLLGAEFPQAFHPGSGLSIEALWEGGCRVRQAFREGSLRPGGTISGPTMMALADVAMYVANGEVTLRCDGEEEPVAHVTATYSIPPGER